MKLLTTNNWHSILMSANYFFMNEIRSIMHPRQEYLLRLIVEDYIKTAEPVGSKYLAEMYDLDISSATIRNEMCVLEQEGFLRQPHTSAGRIPTEKAYVHYLQNVVEMEPSEKNEESMENQIDIKDTESVLKCVAQRLVEISGETAMVSVDKDWSYFTGVSNLFHKPEFQTLETVTSLGDLIDQFDEVMTTAFDNVPFETQVLIGSHSPFGDQLTTMMIRYRLPGNKHGLLGLVGPMRMNYARNLSLLQSAQKYIQDLYDT